jgi:hypothetical protein
MELDDLIKNMLSLADEAGNNPIGAAIVRPLQRYGRVWWDQGQWWFSRRVAEITTYTGDQVIRTHFGEDQFVVADAYWSLDRL